MIVKCGLMHEKNSMYNKPHLFIIAGPNGAGKTTGALKLLPDFLQCEEYVNADGIASGLSQFKPESVAIYAGRTMLSRINELSGRKKSFAFETTLASSSFIVLLKKCKHRGYSTNIIFLWLQSSALAVKRVAWRVKAGGHSIPQETIVRRYQRGIKNFLYLYSPLVDGWTVYDNSFARPELVAKKTIGEGMKIYNRPIWMKIQEVAK
jgi:predicted ABC-type ATPase